MRATSARAGRSFVLFGTQDDKYASRVILSEAKDPYLQAQREIGTDPSSSSGLRMTLSARTPGCHPEPRRRRRIS